MTSYNSSGPNSPPPSPSPPSLDREATLAAIDAAIAERKAILAGPAEFIDRCCYLESGGDGGEGEALDWVPFRLWPAQREVLAGISDARRVVILKARQLGMTWLVLAHAVYLAVVRPVQVVALLSQRDDEAQKLIWRVRGILERLPDWLRETALPFAVSSNHELHLANGSRFMAFPTSGVRSYTATVAVVDEAEFVDDLDAIIGAVKPSVDAGGRLVLLSSVSKADPVSTFKQIYRRAREGRNTYRPIFYGWRARPGRTDAWYADQERDAPSSDWLRQEYPETDDEALAPAERGKLIPYAWLKRCYRPAEPLSEEWLRVELPALGIEPPPAVPGARLYRPPVRPVVDRERKTVRGHRYVAAIDPAEGKDGRDESSAGILDTDTGEEVADLTGTYNPQTIAKLTALLAAWYNRAPIMVERNNHGHACILWLTEHTDLRILGGKDGNYGWLTTQSSKALMFDIVSESVHAGEVTIYSAETFAQLCSIESATLRAPEGLMDDRAIKFGLLLVAALRMDMAASGEALPAVAGKLPDRSGLSTIQAPLIDDDPDRVW